MAPEYADNEKVDERVDVFSYGMVLLELLSGKMPFGDEDVLAWVSIRYVTYDCFVLFCVILFYLVVVCVYSVAFHRLCVAFIRFLQ